MDGIPTPSDPLFELLAAARRRRRPERALLLLDDTLLATVIEAAIARSDALEVVAVTSSEQEALEILRLERVDLVLVDADADPLPVVVRRVEAIARVAPVRIVCLIAAGDGRVTRPLCEAGAASCVLKSVCPDDLAAVVRHAGRGAIFHAPPADDGWDAAQGAAGLTLRELEVLRLAAQGLGNKQIAQRLWVTQKTIKFHLSNVFRKLRVTNRFEATRRAQQLGLLRVVERDTLDGGGPAVAVVGA